MERGRALARWEKIPEGGIEERARWYAARIHLRMIREVEAMEAEAMRRETLLELDRDLRGFWRRDRQRHASLRAAA